MEGNQAALTNRSLRNIRNELEYLADSSAITPQQLSSLLSQLPNDSPTHVSSTAAPVSTPNPPPIEVPQQPLTTFEEVTINEKRAHPVSTSPGPDPPPPPAYAEPTLGPSPLATASALYPYNATDNGDLALSPNDRVFVYEFVNAEWWKGRNERTNAEGIFPSNYVKLIEEKSTVQTATVATPTGFAQVPMLNGQGPTDAAGKSKLNQQGKKFGKKLGNATIFGAGATIGSNIVNGIL
ncbi:MAG: hypothetical protein M1825_006168 [Sarcosagium campestre]|nr:MAG: hypothetical protein M1825_006168 [Sarcosagium campestre]